MYFYNVFINDVESLKNDKMNNYDVKRLALILAVQSEIDGMKAENDMCKNYNLVDPKYNEHAFLKSQRN